MARKQTVKFLMKSELNSMAAYGRSKYQDQQRTYAVRSQMKKEGKSWEECLRVNFSKDYIYSYQTMKNYQYEVDRFANYLAEQGLKKISLEEAKEHILIVPLHQLQILSAAVRYVSTAAARM